MANRWGNNGKSEKPHIGVSEISADGDCSGPKMAMKLKVGSPWKKSYDQLRQAY